jgi:hypothetical protein
MFDYSLHWIGRLFVSVAFLCALVAAFAATQSGPLSAGGWTSKMRFWHSITVQAAMLAALFSALASFF